MFRRLAVRPARTTFSAHRSSSSSSSYQQTEAPQYNSNSRGLAVAAFLAGFVSFHAYKWATYWPEPCDVAVRLASFDPLVRKQIGLPLNRSIFWGGSVTSSSAQVDIPVSGPAGSVRQLQPQ